MNTEAAERRFARTASNVASTSRVASYESSTPRLRFFAANALMLRALVQIAGAGMRPALYCRDFKLGGRHSTLQAEVDLGHPDVPVRIVPCGCDASIRYRRS